MKKVFSTILLLISALFVASCAKVKNKAPEIKGVENVSIALNGTFDPKSEVTVKDDNDKEIELLVFGWDDNYSKKQGIYEIVYFAQDSEGLYTIKTSTVSVGSVNNAPTITGVLAERKFYFGSGDFDPFAGVTANSVASEDITDQLETKGSFSVNSEGTYGVTLYVEFDDTVATKTYVLFVIGDAVPEELDTTKEITLTFAHAMGDSNKKLLEKYAAAFHEIYPNITVTIPDGAGNYDTLKSNVNNAITAGDYPNLIQAYPDHVAEYLNSGVVLNLDPYIKNDKFGLNGDDDLEDIVLSYREENTQYDDYGTFYSLPFNKSTEVMTYNKTVFDKLKLSVPETWQDLIEIAPALKEYGDNLAKEQVLSKNPGKTEAQLKDQIEAAQNLVVPFAYDSTGNGFITFIRQWDGKYTERDQETGKGKYLWTTKNSDGTFTPEENTLKAMQFLKNNSKYITIPEYWDQDYASTPFINQQTFITIGSSAGVRYNISSDGNGFVIDTAPIPYNEETKIKAVIQQGTNVSILSTGDQQVDLASWLFLKYLINTENTLDWAMNTGYLPVRMSAFNSDTYQNFLKDLNYNNQVQADGASLGAKSAYLQQNYMYYDAAFPGSSKAREVVGAALERILTGDGNIEDALKEAYNEATIGK